jgi:DUF917 family protein
MPHTVTMEDVEALAYGGAVLGGGGGGWPETGLRTGRLALEIGNIELWGPDEADPEWRVITSAALGAPTERGNTRPMHYIRAAQLLREVGVEFHGVIAAENGGHNSFGGWLIAAALGVPVVDTPGDGRAHPTAMMGSMGLHRLDYRSVKTGVTEGSEVVAWGTLQTTSNVIRAQARDMKALIAMARDPVQVSYTRKHGAPGAIQMAMDLGNAFHAAKDKGADAKVKTTTGFLGGELVCKGRITEMTIEAKGGFDVGFATIRQGGEEWELGYVNEYMTLEKGGERLATFPDLMTTFDEEGDPVTSAGLKEGQTIYLVNVPKEKILVGDGNRYSENYEVVEAALGKPMVKHLEGYLKG